MGLQPRMGRVALLPCRNIRVRRRRPAGHTCVPVARPTVGRHFSNTCSHVRSSPLPVHCPVTSHRSRIAAGCALSHGGRGHEAG
jgi:hypothetical protein